MNQAACCTDKSCTPETCMNLPQGESCASCVHEWRCTSMFGAKPENTWCEFFPRRFEKTPRPTVRRGPCIAPSNAQG